jgi:hypothetical protein
VAVVQDTLKRMQARDTTELCPTQSASPYPWDIAMRRNKNGKGYGLSVVTVQAKKTGPFNLLQGKWKVGSPIPDRTGA